MHNIQSCLIVRHDAICVVCQSYLKCILFCYESVIYYSKDVMTQTIDATAWSLRTALIVASSERCNMAVLKHFFFNLRFATHLAGRLSRRLKLICAKKGEETYATLSLHCLRFLFTSAPRIFSTLF